MVRARCSSAPTPIDPGCTLAEHEALKANRSAWLQCVKAGFFTDPFAGITYEMRHCPKCRSSLNKPAEVVVVRYLDEPAPSSPPVVPMPAPQLAAEIRGAA